MDNYCRCLFLEKDTGYHTPYFLLDSVIKVVMDSVVYVVSDMADR